MERQCVCVSKESYVVVTVATNGGEKSIRQQKSECESEMLHERKFQYEMSLLKRSVHKVHDKYQSGV
jgi:hypothetical protein